MSYRYHEYSRRRVLRQRKRMLLLLHTSYAMDDGGHAPEEQPPKRMNECRVRLWMKNNAASMKAAQNALWTKNANYDNERNFESNIIRYSTHFRLVWPFEQQRGPLFILGMLCVPTSHHIFPTLILVGIPILTFWPHPASCKPEWSASCLPTTNRTTSFILLPLSQGNQIWANLIYCVW